MYTDILRIYYTLSKYETFSISECELMLEKMSTGNDQVMAQLSVHIRIMNNVCAYQIIFFVINQILIQMRR